jgi:hypothetical protein
MSFLVFYMSFLVIYMSFLVFYMKIASPISSIAQETSIGGRWVNASKACGG